MATFCLLVRPAMGTMAGFSHGMSSLEFVTVNNNLQCGVVLVVLQSELIKKAYICCTTHTQTLAVPRQRSN